MISAIQIGKALEHASSPSGAARSFTQPFTTS